MIHWTAAAQVPRQYRTNKETPMQQEVRPKPALVVSDSDLGRLMELVSAVQHRAPEAAEGLIAEIERAEVVETGAVPADVVQMGSTVEFRAGEGPSRRVTLVFPAEADIAAGRVSVLTPIGTALIGLAVGESIAWTARDGRQHELTILSVEPPAGR
jgi:regulator of nucleoside diphosphate kinase